MSEEDDASVHLLEETMSAAWRFYDWVSAAEDPELYVMRILINQFRHSGSADGAVPAWGSLQATLPSVK